MVKEDKQKTKHWGLYNIPLKNAAGAQIAQRVLSYVAKGQAYTRRYKPRNSNNYYIYGPWSSPEFRIYRGGGGYSGGAGAGDVWRPQRIQKEERKKERSFLEEDWFNETLKQRSQQQTYFGNTRRFRSYSRYGQGLFRRPVDDEEYNPLTTEHRQWKLWKPLWSRRLTNYPDPLYWRRPYQRGPFRHPHDMQTEAYNRWRTRVIRRAKPWPLDENRNSNREEYYSFFSAPLYISTEKVRKKGRKNRSKGYGNYFSKTYPSGRFQHTRRYRSKLRQSYRF